MGNRSTRETAADLAHAIDSASEASSTTDGNEQRTVLIANPSADTYGSDLQMLESISGMVERGWRVVVALPADGALVERIRARSAGVCFVDFPVLRRADASARGILALAAAGSGAIWKLRRLIRRVSPDVVYVNTVTLPWWIAAAKATRTPVVCHVHEAEAQDSKMVSTALNAPLLLASALIVISEPARQAVASNFRCLSSRMSLIYNGVPQPSVDIPEPGPSKETKLVTVGRLSPRKAPDVAINAVAILRDEGRRVSLEVCGTPFAGYEWYADELRDIVSAQGLDGAVKFSGYTSPIWPALERADIAVAPSLREPFGNAVVEAQLAGRPVVAAAAMGHLETVEDGVTGLLVRPSDPKAMAAAVARLIDDPGLRQQLATDARSQALRRFSIGRYRQEVADLVEEQMEVLA